MYLLMVLQDISEISWYKKVIMKLVPCFKKPLYYCMIQQTCLPSSNKTYKYADLYTNMHIPLLS